MALPHLALWFGSPPDPPGGDFPSRPHARIADVADDGASLDTVRVARIRGGDAVAFEQLYHETFRPLWQFAAALLGTRNGAEDVVHDVFLDVWRRRATWTVQGSVRGYLFGAVRHQVTSLRRRAHAGAQIEAHASPVPSSPIAPDVVASEADIAERIQRAIDALPERQREAVLLRWVGELNATDIGRQLHISEAAVRKLLHKADVALRQAVGDLIG